MRFEPSPYLLLGVACLFWAGNFVIGRAVSDDIPPIALNFWRWCIALAILFPFTAAGLWQYRAAIVQNWRILLLLAVTGVGAFHSFIYLALASTTAINAALFMAAVPMVIPPIAFGLDREVLRRRQVLGIALSLLGVLTIITRADPGVLAGLRFNAGDLWMLGAVPLWSLYSVLLKRRPTVLPPVILLVSLMCVGVALLLPVYLWEFAALGGFAVNAASLLSIGYLALFASLIAYIFWNRGVAQIGASKAGPFMHLIPVLATAMAIGFLGEAFRPYHLMGVGLIAAGIVLTNRAPRPARGAARADGRGHEVKPAPRQAAGSGAERPAKIGD
ncbi:MAG: DMT family transporter [Kiloniellaceae bacterium]